MFRLWTKLDSGLYLSWCPHKSTMTVSIGLEIVYMELSCVIECFLWSLICINLYTRILESNPCGIIFSMLWKQYQGHGSTWAWMWRTRMCLSGTMRTAKKYEPKIPLLLWRQLRQFLWQVLSCSIFYAPIISFFS